MPLFKTFFFEETNEVNTYMIGCADTREVFLIDAGGDSDHYDQFLKENNATLKGIVITHSHWDHTEALDSILKRFHVPVYSMNGESTNGQKVSEGDTLPIGKLENRILFTSGHTPDSITLLIGDKFAFVGDAIFAGSIGGTSSENQKRELKDHIRNKILTLPENVLLCSGHGPLTTVGIEKQWNPLLQDE